VHVGEEPAGIQCVAGIGQIGALIAAAGETSGA